MTEQLWFVAGSLAIMVVVAMTRYATKAIAAYVVADIGDALQDRWQKDIQNAVVPLAAELKEITNEVTTNGGGSLKDRVLSVERQLEQLLTDERHVAALRHQLASDPSRFSEPKGTPDGF